MALSAAQYSSLKLNLRSLLSGSPAGSGPNMGEADLLGFWAQLMTESAGAAVLSAPLNERIDFEFRSRLCGTVGRLPDADWTSFFTQLASDSSGAANLSAVRYAAFKLQLRAVLSAYSLSPGTISEATLFGYFSPYASQLGQVATRARVPVAAASGASQMCRTAHYARDTISSLQVAWANWYVQSNVGETNLGGVITIVASVEYPAGTFTQLKFSGTSTGSILNGATLLSDAATVSIPMNARFFVRWLWSSTGSLPGMTALQLKDISIGDAYEATAVDKTMSGTVVDGGLTISAYPVAIVAMTSRRRLALLGDSRVQGQGDNDANDISGDCGELERPFGPLWPYINLACFGEKSPSFLASNTKRLALAQYCNTAISEYGINDIGTGVSAAAMEVYQQQIRALVPGIPFYACTLSPASTGAWTLVDLSDQTVDVNNPQRVIYNDWVRANGGGFTGYFDNADVGESSRNSGKWKANGTPAFYTGDGVHGTGNTNLLSALAFPIAFTGNFLSVFDNGVIQSVQSDLGVISASGLVSQWNDQSASAKHYTQGTGAKQPLLTVGLNGNPGILFDGVNSVLTSTLNIPAPSVSPTWLGIVFRQVGWVNNTVIVCDAASTGHCVLTVGSTPTVGMYNSTTGNAIASPAVGTWEALEAGFTNTIWDYLRRGPTKQQPFSGTVGNNASTSRYIGAFSGGANSAIEVLHVCALSRIPSNGEIAAWRAAVTTKYGVTVSV